MLAVDDDLLNTQFAHTQFVPNSHIHKQSITIIMVRCTQRTAAEDHDLPADDSIPGHDPAQPMYD